MKISPQIVRYCTVGTLAVALDVGLFRALLFFHGNPVVAAAIAYATVVLMHFTLNRAWSFRAFHRPAMVQAPRYGLVVGCTWLITIGVVAYCTSVLTLTPLQAKAAAIAVTLPIGFFGHKYITYGGR